MSNVIRLRWGLPILIGIGALALTGCGPAPTFFPQAPATAATNGAPPVTTQDQGPATAEDTSQPSNADATGSDTTWYLPFEKTLTDNGFVTAISNDSNPRSTAKSEIPPYEQLTEVNIGGYVVVGYEPGDHTGLTPHVDDNYWAYCTTGSALDSDFKVDVSYTDQYGPQVGIVTQDGFKGPPPQASLDALARFNAQGSDLADLSHLTCSDGNLSYTG